MDLSRRDFGDDMRSLSLILFVALVGCADEPSREDLMEQVDYLEAENANLRERLETAQYLTADASDAAETASEAAEAVKSEADRFGWEDWRDVVPDVQSAASDASVAAEEAESAASEAYSAVN